MCTQKTEVNERGEQVSDRVLFFDDGTMDQLTDYTFELDPLEQAISIISSVFESESNKMHIVVGTAYAIPEEQVMAA